VESKILNFPDAMKLAHIMVSYGGNYVDTINPREYVIMTIHRFTDEEMQWILEIVDAPNFTPLGQLDEVVKFILDSGVVKLCLSGGSLWTA